MLVMSLIVSLVLLVVVNGVVYQFRNPTGLVVAVCLAVLLPFSVFTAVTVQGLLLVVGVFAWRGSGRGRRAFLAVSTGATVVSYSLAGLMAWGYMREYARLRTLYPYVSMEDRLPVPKPAPFRPTLTAAAVGSLDRLEARLENPGSGYRNFQLERLHEHAVGLFINSPGFGVARMSRPHELGLRADLSGTPVPDQPGPRLGADWSPGELERPGMNDEALLRELFEESVTEFVFARGFGFFKDRRHVAGFEPHGFRELPEPKERWKVQSLDLVGLVLHDEPTAYVSARLPRMGELRQAPTRPLDDFEAFALNALNQGDDVFISEAGEGIRMLGAVRSVNQCAACHGGERGDLLGAFSYSLRPAGD